jgi:hypothetical protein
METAAHLRGSAAQSSARSCSAQRPKLLAAARLVFSGERLPCNAAAPSDGRGRQRVYRIGEPQHTGSRSVGQAGVLSRPKLLHALGGTLLTIMLLSNVSRPLRACCAGPGLHLLKAHSRPGLKRRGRACAECVAAAEPAVSAPSEGNEPIGFVSKRSVRLQRSFPMVAVVGMDNIKQALLLGACDTGAPANPSPPCPNPNPISATCSPEHGARGPLEPGRAPSA